MKRILIMVVMLTVVFSFVGCSKVPAGYVGIKVYLLGSKKGVDMEELKPGRYWIGYNRDLYRFPTFTQNYVWTQDATEGSEDDESISFQTMEGLTVDADVGISYAIIPDKASLLFQKYRKGIDEITDVYLRNMVRDAFVTVASTKPIEFIYGAGKAELVKDVEDLVRNQVGEMINIERIYLINDLRLPDTVIAAINAKITATQKAQQRENEIREAEAEAKKKVVAAEGDAKAILTRAQAEAEANALVNKSLTGTLVDYKAVSAWDGKLPTYTGGGAVPFIDIK